MASAWSLMDENNFMCSICLDVFTKPVSLLCGHNYCLACITQHWDSKVPKLPNCPLCGETFPIRPVLRVNTFIEEMVTNFKKSTQKKCEVRSETEGNGGVMCEKCGVPALKSCLVCFVSLCHTHLEPHQRLPNLKTHKLIEPTDNLEGRICKIHHEALEMFCRDEQAFVCERCIRTNHRRHETVLIREEAEFKKTQLDMEKTRMDQWAQVRQQKVHEIQESMDLSRNMAEKAMSDSNGVISALVDYMKRSRTELATVIKLTQLEMETKAKGLIKELEDEIEDISQRNNDLNVTLSDDPFRNLENLIPLVIPQPQLKDWSAVKVQAETFEVKEALSTLTATVNKEIRMLCDPDLKKLKEFAVDVAFDPDTAHASLIISEDGKQVSYSERRRIVPKNPGRFSHALNVLANQGFSKGKFYYEVQVKDKSQWDLGVANESINRNGEVRLSPRNGFWTMWLRNGQATANAGPPVSVRVRNNLKKIGVFVDYDEGQVCFYDVDARVQIYTFDHCNFTEKIFPFFCPCSSDDGKNTAPLIIIPVQK
ncbi:E3 ubiquitin-protein ligase TRIM21-like [Eucyclogobius newberryi]|uniref:E3 ubiquitin-protein ligase TRIM21-like n=1 Tax=Eucyclogobius newberryi TaxID=166745 RepID=UPI003B59D644